MEIDGLDEETAEELQARARDFIEEENKKLDEKRKELGVADDLLDTDGLDMKMIVTLGENDVKSLEDLAGCATDDLTGWTERVDGERKHYDGILEGYKVSAEEAEDLIMRARVKAGWITQEDLDAMRAAEVTEEGEEAEAEENA
jgi:N utilization substance protein A